MCFLLLFFFIKTRFCLFSESNIDPQTSSLYHHEPVNRSDFAVVGTLSGRALIQCDFCSSPFYSELHYKKHLSQNHSNQLPFSCELCLKGFFTKSGLKRHLTAEHEERKFICVICDSRFKRKENLKSHLKCAHKLLSCSYCTLTFKTADEFNRHNCRGQY